MKNHFYQLLILLILGSCALTSCTTDDEPSSDDTTINIRQYKWVCRISDEPLVDDDYQWAIFDDYVITLYFVSDYECVIRYDRKHFDTEDGTSYEHYAQTVKYTVQGKNIILDKSDFTEIEFVYCGEFLSSNDFIYEKEAINSSDWEWINENFKHIELDPDESTSTAFKGLKEIYDDTWGGVAFGNPQCDNEGRLIYYKSEYDRNVRYEYSDNTIISKSGYTDSYEQITYTLTNGLITSFVRQSFDEDGLRFSEYCTVKYDSNKRIVQIIYDDGEDSKHIYAFKWNSSGDIYESSIVFDDETKPSYIYQYEYLSSSAQIPGMIMGGNELGCAINLYIDPILLMEGYYGNSMSKHNLKSRYAEMVSYNEPYERYNWSYSFDSNGKISKLTQEYEDLYHNGENNKTKVFTFKWE